MKCPKCQREIKQHKVGRTTAGSQRYRCYVCKHTYTLIKKARGYSDELRQQSVHLYVDGMNLRRIGRHLGIHHQTVANWVTAYVSQLPEAPMPEQVKTAEMDELFTFIGDKKTGSTSPRS
jgi:transposase-like protein